MSASKQHTPGPWSYAEEPDPHTQPLVGYRIRAADTVIAEIYARPYRVAVWEENARLITAAPDLLAALRAVLPYAESRLEDMQEAERGAYNNRPASVWAQAKEDVRKAEAAFQAAKAAISAAEGRR